MNRTPPIVTIVTRADYMAWAAIHGHGLLHDVVARNDGCTIARVRVVARSVIACHERGDVLAVVSRGVVHVTNPDTPEVVCVAVNPDRPMADAVADAVDAALAYHDLPYRVAKATCPRCGTFGDRDEVCAYQ